MAQRRRWTRFVAITALGVLTIAGGPGSPPSSAVVPPAVAPATIDDAFTAIAREVAGFGGAYVSGDAAVGETERLFIWLRQPAKRDRRAPAARDHLARTIGARFAKSSFEVLPAAYDYTQLSEWRVGLNDAFAVGGVVFTDIDERHNRLVVGMKDVSRAAEVRAVGERHGVPTEAIHVVAASGFRPSLRSEHRPMRGGLQISFQTGAFGAFTATCTLGYPATRGGVNGFVTNSHCSRTQAEVDNGRHWQPDRLFLDRNQIGTETVDPGYFTGGACPAGFRCRQVVTKVGRTTGLTSGLVTHTCITAQQEDSDVVMLCEHLADYQSDSGESGSPVFHVNNSPTTNDVAALGINWGGGVVDGVDVGAFSHFAAVASEIGSLTVCASGFSC